MPSPSPSDKSCRNLWHPDDRTLIIVEDISSPNILNFGVEFYSKGPVTDLYPQKIFLDWKYTGPVLDIPEEFDNLVYMRDEIIDRLTERDEWDDEAQAHFISLVKRFSAYLKYDISGEMSDYRKHLIEMLTDIGDCEFQGVEFYSNLRVIEIRFACGLFQPHLQAMAGSPPLLPWLAPAAVPRPVH